jgi:ankyrin repeat protein
MSSLAAKSERNSPLLTLPNELFFEVASHLENFKDLNALLRTTRFFHTLLNSHLYRRAVGADNRVRQYIVHWVVFRDRVTSLGLLFEHGLSVHHKLYGEPLLRWFCLYCRDQERSVRFAELLIESGADVNEKGSFNYSTLLHGAVSNGNNVLAALLLANGADADAATLDSDRRTALHFAVKKREVDQDRGMIDLLIAHGAAVDARDGSEDTPLLFAAHQGNAHLIPALLGHGADACAYDEYRNTPLHHLNHFRNSDQGVAKLLLEHGADVNATDISGRTPLHWCVILATWNDNLWKMEFLLENGAYVNALCSHGRSPLQKAFKKFRKSRSRRDIYRDCAIWVAIDAIRLLIAHGADVSVLTSEERAQAVRMGIQID